MTNSTLRPRDLLKDWRAVLLAYGLPSAVIFVTGALPMADIWRGVVWASASGVMSAVCFTNARRCGRLHCFLTGPFLALAALASLLYALGGLPLGPGGWSLIGMSLLVGSALLMILPEAIAGRYGERLRASHGR